MAHPYIRESVIKSLYKELIPKCANGNADADAYLRDIFFAVRIVDDVYDNDQEMIKNDIVQAFFNLMGKVPHNKFFQENINALSAIHVIGFNAWKNANGWSASNDEAKRIYAHISRDFICEILILVAFLTGGQEHMEKISPQVRETFLKEFGE